MVIDGGSFDGAPLIDATPPAPDAFTSGCTPASGTGLTTELVASGLTDPLFLTSPTGDPRLFIIEQPGQIRIVKDDVLVATPFLDIEGIVRDQGDEQGLLGLAFHPNYAQNGRFFVNYTASSPAGATVVAEYTVSGDADVASTAETRLLEVAQPFSNHNGGMLAFGPDGYLYIGMGDGGLGGDPQDHGEDTTTLLGSILRIDVDSGTPYGIPASNPFSNSANGVDDPRPEIWAYGLRNPWRFSFDRDTGDLYIGDVGQGAMEEIDVQLASSTGGENYGWDIMEGSLCHEPSVGCDTSGKVMPIAEYPHALNNPVCSVTGGYVYRGECIPDLDGRYFYGDYCSGEIWTLAYPGNTTPVDQTISGTALTSFGQDAAGELYFVNRGNGSNGTVRRIIPAP
jgi:glucose/arabinose dehydrogenase